MERGPARRGASDPALLSTLQVTGKPHGYPSHVSGAFEALAGSTRRTIVERLAREEMTAGEIAALLRPRAPRRLTAPAGPRAGLAEAEAAAQHHLARAVALDEVEQQPRRPRPGRSVSTLSTPRSPAERGPDDRSRDERPHAGARRIERDGDDVAAVFDRPGRDLGQATSGRPAPSPSGWPGGSPR